jgi:NADPH:quinone reductase-like Zn-dependent oxidoreductase
VRITSVPPITASLDPHEGPKQHANDLAIIKELAAAGELRPVIDRCYPPEQIAEAHRYVDGGHKRGNVIVTVGPRA